jgi:hypothetical protein
MLMSEFQLPYKALPHSEFEAVKDKLSQVARTIGQSAAVESVFFKVFASVYFTSSIPYPVEKNCSCDYPV